MRRKKRKRTRKRRSSRMSSSRKQRRKRRSRRGRRKIRLNPEQMYFLQQHVQSDQTSLTSLLFIQTPPLPPLVALRTYL